MLPGIVGLVPPALQGIHLIVGGFGLLSISNEGLRRWVNDLGNGYSRRSLGSKKIKMNILPQPSELI